MTRNLSARRRSVAILFITLAVLVGLLFVVRFTMENRAPPATDFERRCVESAQQSVTSLYREFGFDVRLDPNIDITFSDLITIGEGSTIEVLGLFDRATDSIWLTHFDSESFRSSRLVEMAPPECAYRMLAAHEIAHYFNSKLAPNLHPVIDELVAGYVQFATVDDCDLERCLANCEQCRICSLTLVSIASYVHDPTSFLAGGYRYFASHQNMLVRVLSGNPIIVRDPMMTEYSFDSE